MVQRVLVTGAAGAIGSMLRTRLARPGRVLRLLDVVPLPELATLSGEPVAAGPVDPDAEPAGEGPAGTEPAGEEWVRASATDLDAMTAACRDVDAVLHLGGLSVEHSWERIAEVNIGGAYAVFEAARRAGVPRVVFASSNHAMGFHTPDEYPVPEAAVPLPDTYYGVSKVTGEALGALYAHRYGLDVIAVRLLACAPEPVDVRALSTWLSPDDCARLMEACLAAPDAGYRVVYGVSANTRGGWVATEAARALGFEARDDSEAFAARLLAEQGPLAPDDPLLAHLGGAFCDPALDAPVPE